MKQDIFGRALGILQILVAIWSLSLANFNQVMVSALLFAGGTILLLQDVENEFLRLLRRLITYAALFASIFLIFKVLLGK